jgi:hypothetical protein
VLTSPGLRASLLRALSHPTFPSQLAQAAARYPSLAAFPDGPALARTLDATAPFSLERDRVFGDLLRWRRDSEERAPMDAATYAALRVVRSTTRRLVRKVGEDRDEALSEVVSVLPAVFADFDPDRRSPHVTAGLRQDLWRALTRARVQARRDGPETQRDVAEQLSVSGPEDEATQSPWAERPARLASVHDLLDEGDIQLGIAALRALTQEGALSLRGALLIEGLLLRRATATELAADHGIDRTTVARHVDQTVARLGEALRRKIREGGTSIPARLADLDGCS